MENSIRDPKNIPKASYPLHKASVEREFVIGSPTIQYHRFQFRADKRVDERLTILACIYSL